MAREVDLGNVRGPQGIQGLKGDEGYSPIVSLTQVDDGVEITVQNKDNNQTVKVKDGVIDPNTIEALREDVALQKQYRKDYVNLFSKRIKDLESSCGYTKVHLTTNQIFNGLIPNSATKIIFTNVVAPEGTNPQDCSLEKDKSVVYWIVDDVMYVSSQDIKKRIMAPKPTPQAFYAKKNLTRIIFDNFDTSEVTSFRNLFSGCENLEQLDLSGFDTSNVTDMKTMFANCKKLKYLNISNFDTSKVTSMYALFGNCYMLENLDVSNFDTSKVTDMAFMFSFCQALKYLDVSNFDTSKVTDMNTMFQRCESLTSLNLSNFDTSNVTNMKYMFNNCPKLEHLDISNFDTSKVTDMAFMFSFCQALKYLDVSNFDTSNVTDITSMFQHCSSLRKCPIPKNLKRIDCFTYNHLSGFEDEVVTIPSTVENIVESHIFYNCGKDETFKRIAVEDGNSILKEIEGCLYSKDGSILYAIPRALTVAERTLRLPEGVTKMCVMSFSRIHTVDKLVLPNSYEIVRMMNDDESGDRDPVHGNSLNCAIYIHTSIKEYEIKEDNPRYSSYDGCIYSKDGTELISVPVKYEGNLNVKEGCTTIGQEAFWVQRITSFTNIQTIHIPASVITIETNQLTAINSISNITISVDPNNARYEVSNSKLVEKTA